MYVCICKGKFTEREETFEFFSCPQSPFIALRNVCEHTYAHANTLIFLLLHKIYVCVWVHQHKSIKSNYNRRYFVTCIITFLRLSCDCFVHKTLILCIVSFSLRQRPKKYHPYTQRSECVLSETAYWKIYKLLTRWKAAFVSCVCPMNAPRKYLFGAVQIHTGANILLINRWVSC